MLKTRKKVIMMVGKNIRKYRKNKNMTQDDLAEKLSVTRQAISNWETEKTQPDIETLQKISQTLEVSIEEIIYGAKREGKAVMNNNTVKKVTKGLSFGSALAMVISYFKWKSIGWAIFHGLLSWVYVVYYVIRYGWS